MALELKTGDWLMLGSPNPDKIQREIMRSCESVHWHDELIYVNEDGGAFTGTAHIPHFELIPLEERIAQHTRDEGLFCIFRWHNWTDRSPAMYEDWQHDVGMLLKYTAELQIKYPIGDILRIWRNRHTRRWLNLPMLTPKSEQKLYCTESCFLIYEQTGLSPFSRIGPQPYPAPIHAERLYWSGQLKPVPDWNYNLLSRLSNHAPNHGYPVPE